MKKTIVLLAVILLVSCKKQNDEKFPENPDWLTAKISQMETPAEYTGTTIYLYKWDNSYYYLIQLPYANCGMCEFYNYLGVKVEWTQDKIDDFQKNAVRIKIVWQRNTITYEYNDKGYPIKVNGEAEYLYC